eukprot:TRINITY_DN3489_c0_g1_i1.p1 TRINITY_DN3489_c0_g1~~TRINITY_DN3489_c0_g1_i1.p1  ORF type:complete len:253 (+),score=93.56 TRINITY_DN3489_c0_g1_i1:108-761(+)
MAKGPEVELELCATSDAPPDAAVAFKIMTSNPQRYVVQPHHIGLLERGERVVVVVGLRLGGCKTPGDDGDRFQVEARLLRGEEAQTARTAKQHRADVFKRRATAEVQRERLSVHFDETPPRSRVDAAASPNPMAFSPAGSEQTAPLPAALRRRDAAATVNRAADELQREVEDLRRQRAAGRRWGAVLPLQLLALLLLLRPAAPRRAARLCVLRSARE